MKIGLGQLNSTIGDFEGNAAVCAEAVGETARQGADLVVLPELALTGSPPRDLLFDQSFVEASLKATRDFARRLGDGPPVIVGSIAESGCRSPHHPGLLNAAYVLAGGEIRTVVGKRLLPGHDIHFEPRWFVPGREPGLVDIDGQKIGILISDDLDDEHSDIHPLRELVAAGAERIVAICASPFRRQVLGERLGQARRSSVPLVLVNACGASDELIFDGRSFVLNGRGETVVALPAFEESVAVADTEGAAGAALPETPADLKQALVLGIRDFVQKNRLPHAFLGLSGGVDSALVACLARDALGPSRVTALAIPSRYTDPRSTDSARQLAAVLGIGFEVVPLARLHAAAEETLAALIDGAALGSAIGENIQARLRMIVLMAHVNRHGGVLLNTTNKTELALGYGTLYGDTAGTLCPIADLTKTDVWEMARSIGEIPPFILDRPPSAELRPGQVDPFDYATVAPQVEELVRSHRSDAAVRRSEHKRRSMGVILKVSEKAFGSGRLVPITRR